MFMQPCPDCIAYPPQYAPTYQPSPVIYPPPVYNPTSHYNPLQYTYSPATALGQAPGRGRGLILEPMRGYPLAGDAVDREVAFVWENRPTRAGLYRFTLPLSGPINCAKGQEYGILTCLPESQMPSFPFSDPVFAGAFVQHAGDGTAQLLLGDAIESAIKGGSVAWGTEAGQVQMVNRPYIYFEEAGGGHQIKGLFMYIITTEDSPREGLDPNTTSSYFNKDGKLLYEQDAAGNVWQNPEMQGTTTGFPAVLIVIAKWGAIVAGLYSILGYFGFIGKGAQRAITTLVAAGVGVAKDLANKAIQIGGSILSAAAPWVTGGLLAYFLIKAYFKI